MKKHYDLLILGATALGVGLAEAHPELSCVILETSSSIAGEFSSAYKGGSAHEYEPKSANAKALLDDFRNRKAIDEKGEWFPAISPIISNHLKATDADCYFFAALKEVGACGDGYSITFNAFGIDHSFTASKIVDTTSLFTLAPFVGEKAPEMREFALMHYDINKKLHKTVVDSDDIGLARKKLYENNTNILKEAWELSYTPKETSRKVGAAVWMPSVGCDNFLAAYDAGASMTLPEGEYIVSAPKCVDDGEYDIIVVGLGTAGAIAALTAKDEGMRVLGLENLPLGGGVATAGAVLTYYYGYKGGVYKKLDARANERNGKFASRPSWTIGPDQKATEIDYSLEGIDLRYRATFTDVIREGNKVIGVIWFENGVKHSARAKFVLDCSADSAVCVNAGCEMQGGREIDGGFQPYSSMQLLENSGLVSGRYCDNGRMNQYDPDAFGEGIVNASSFYLHLMDDYSRHTFFGIVPLIGLREGLRIVGEENVEFGPMISGGWAKNPVYYGFSNLDNHGQDNALESRMYQDWNTICSLWGYTIPIPIPMGALIPKDFEGILAAGRNVAIDHDLATGLRMKDDVSKSGEAAARIAVHAIRNGVRARELDVTKVREDLFKSECIRPSDEIIRIEKQRYNEFHEFPLWCDDDEKIAEGLATDAPEYFMWSSYMNKKQDVLLSLLDSESENARTNAALALSLLDVCNDRMVEILCASALKKDGYTPDAGRKYVMPRSVSAINALGRVGAVGALPALYELMADDSFISTLPFKKSEFLADYNDYFFQYRSNILTSLRDIAAKNPEKRDEIKAKAYEYLDGKTLSVSLMWSSEKIDFTKTIRGIIDSI